MKNFTINGSIYGYHPMLPVPAVHFSVSAATQLSGVLVSCLDNFDGSIVEALESTKDSGDESIFFSVLSNVTRSLPLIDPDGLTDLMSQAMSIAVCQDGNLSNAQVRDQWFESHKGDYIPVAIKIIWETSKDFLFGAIPGLAQVLLEEAPETQSTSQKTTQLTGSSPELPPGKMPRAPIQT